MDAPPGPSRWHSTPDMLVARVRATQEAFREGDRDLICGELLDLSAEAARLARTLGRRPPPQPVRRRRKSKAEAPG